MKALERVIMVSAIVLAFGMQAQSQQVQPAGQNQDKVQVKNGGAFTPGVFIDKDSNGVCDNREMRAKSGKGANFVDKDGDGVCDNRMNKEGNGRHQGCNGQGMKQGKGEGHGKRNGQGHGYCRGGNGWRTIDKNDSEQKPELVK